MVLYILTGYRVFGIVSLDQLTGARHTPTHLIMIGAPWAFIKCFPEKPNVQLKIGFLL